LINSSGYTNNHPPASLGTSTQNIEIQTIGGLILVIVTRWLPAIGFGFNLVLLISGFSIQ
jgi:hypothetical protein